MAKGKAKTPNTEARRVESSRAEHTPTPLPYLGVWPRRLWRSSRTAFGGCVCAGAADPSVPVAGGELSAKLFETQTGVRAVAHSDPLRRLLPGLIGYVVGRSALVITQNFLTKGAFEVHVVLRPEGSPMMSPALSV